MKKIACLPEEHNKVADKVILINKDTKNFELSKSEVKDKSKEKTKVVWKLVSLEKENMEIPKVKKSTIMIMKREAKIKCCTTGQNIMNLKKVSKCHIFQVAQQECVGNP